MNEIIPLYLVDNNTTFRMVLISVDTIADILFKAYVSNRLFFAQLYATQ